MKVRIFNPNQSHNGGLSLDTSIVEVEDFTVEAVFAALKARRWFFGDGGTFAALRHEDMERRGTGSLLLFDVKKQETVTTEWVAHPRFGF